MKIQKQLSKKRKNKIYYKYVIVLPEELIKESELKEGDEVEGKAEKYGIIIKKVEKMQ